MVALWTTMALLLGCGGAPERPAAGGEPEVTTPRKRAPGAKAKRRRAAPVASDDTIVLELAPGYSRSAHVLLPPSYNPEGSQRWPVLFTFHGGRGGGSGEQMTPSWRNHRDDFIQIYPNGQDLERSKGAWWSPPGKPTTDAFVQALVAEIDQRYKTDPDRRYVTGFSAGALFTYRLACSTDLFRGFAAISHPMMRETPQVCTSDRTRPMLISAGTADHRHGGHTLNGNTYASMRETMAFWAERNGCKPKPTEEPITGISGDPTQPTRFRFRGCEAPFRYIEIEGAGHNWPGGKAGDDETGERSQFAISDEIADFLRENADL